MIKPILRALNYMKNIGIVHKDIKPDNICFIDDLSDHVKLVDFGSACYHRDEILLSEPFGCAYYIAPEMI